MSLFPPKEEKIKLRDFGAKKFKRLYSRQRTKKKKGISEEKAAQPKKEKSIADTFNLINQIAELFITRFSPHIRIKTLRARITIRASDAASVAIKYGIVINLISCFAGILSNAIEKGRELDLSDVTVRADYLSEKSEIKLKLHCYVRVWHILDISGRIIYNNINKSKKKA